MWCTALRGQPFRSARTFCCQRLYARSLDVVTTGLDGVYRIYRIGRQPLGARFGFTIQLHCLYSIEVHCGLGHIMLKVTVSALSEEMQREPYVNNINHDQMPEVASDIG